MDFCSPSLSVGQGNLDEFFFWTSDKTDLLESAIPTKRGWSSFTRTFKTKPNSSEVTVYLMQEGRGPFSASYFDKVYITQECGQCSPPTGRGLTEAHCAETEMDTGKQCRDISYCDCSGCKCMDNKTRVDENAQSDATALIVWVIVPVLIVLLILAAVLFVLLRRKQTMSKQSKKKQTSSKTQKYLEDNLRSLSFGGASKYNPGRNPSFSRSGSARSQSSAVASASGRNLTGSKRHVSVTDSSPFMLDMAVALRLFNIRMTESPENPLPVTKRTFRTSNFRKFYGPATISGEPRNAGKLLVAVESLIRAFTKRRNITDLDAEGGLEMLYDEAWSKSEELRSDVSGASLYFWTSAKTIGGFEFCGILNDALRRDHPSDLAYAIVVVRGINMVTNASINSEEKQKSLKGEGYGLTAITLNRT